MKQQNFESMMLSFGYEFDLYKVFEDFLDLVIASFSRNYETGISFLENEYLKIISKYSKSKSQLFAELLAVLIIEMEVGKNGDSNRCDILGDFFENNISHGKKGQFFTPEHICTMMAQMTCNENSKESLRPQSIIDPACGSGRMLLSSSRILGPINYYYGIDIDATCVKMTIINLFLNGVFKAEIMQANALYPDDFIVSYQTSFVPLGIYKITEKEKSPLWNRVRMGLHKKEKKEINFPSFSIQDGSKLSIF